MMPQRRLAIAVSSALLCAMLASAPAAQAAAPEVFANPIDLPVGGRTVKAEEGFVAVRENRRDPNSRTILVNYLRIFARDGSSPGVTAKLPNGARAPAKRDPVFGLPGGPGDLLDRRDFSKPWYPHDQINGTLERFAAHRDVVIVNQRGNHYVLGPFGAFEVPEPKDIDQAKTSAEKARKWRESLRSKFSELKAGGVDLAGYDIVNAVADVDDVRAALGYGKVILYGASFGSQWGLSYIRQHPEHVSRAAFSGVEPIDYGYDSADALWATLQRIAKSAESSSIASQLPPGGLIKAVQTIETRLAAKPVTVRIVDPDTRSPRDVTVTREDFQSVLMQPVGYVRNTPLREGVRVWPKFITEIYNGDYRQLAARKLDTSKVGRGMPANFSLVDHSIGISAARDAVLKKEPAQQWLGDPNVHYRVWADVTPTPVVDDKFRTFYPIEVPVLLVQGDMDTSTPLENALEQGKYLSNGAVVIARNGTHLVAAELYDHQPKFKARMADFIDLDLQPNPDPKAFFRSLPAEVTIPIDYEAPEAKPLYERTRG